MPQDASPLTIHACFREQARHRPDAVAVRHGGSSLTYAGLDAASDEVAAVLATRGVGRGHVVPVLLERGPLLVAVLLGVLKSGAAYTALDPRWPAERRAEVLAQAPSPVVVALPDTTSDRAWDPGDVLAAPAGSTRSGRAVPPDRAGGADPCAVYFTSGTTGHPRGALVPHEGTVRLFRDPDLARLGPGAATLQGSALAWDGLGLELWSMLTTGGTCLLPEVPTVTGDAVREAVASGLTLLFLTATLFDLLVDEDLGCFTGVAHVMTGGERLSTAHAARFAQAHPGTRLTNVYGPVETSILLTARDVRAEDLTDPEGVPLGTALADTELHVLAPGAPGGREVPDGQVGELHVSGPRVGLGYLGTPDQSAFAVREVAGTARRTYATGDLVVRRDGLLHFAGRRDRQVKVRGHRVEPAEVEAVVHSVPGVASCRVVPLPDRDGAGVGGLGAFWTSTAGARDDDARLEVRVRERVTAALPTYARPGVLRRLERLPMTGNGKLDERALVQLASPPPTAPPAPRDAGDSPEQVVREEVATLVGLAEPPPGRTLTELGATSLDLARLGMRLQRRLGVRMPPEELAGAADLDDLVRRAAESPRAPTGPAAGARTDADAAAGASAPVAPSPLQAVLALAPQRTAEEVAPLLCPVVWAVRGAPPSTAVLGAALQDVQNRHDALRSAWDTSGPQGPRAVVLPAEQAPRVPLLDLGDLHRDERDDEPGQGDWQRAQHELVAALSAGPLALGEGRNWRAGVLRVAPGHWLLGVVVHHVAFDGWSVAVLAEDLSVALAARSAQRSPRWPVPAPTSAALAAEREALGRFHDDPAEVAAWREHLAGTVPVVPSQAPRPCPGPCPPGAHLHRRTTAPGALARWRALGAREGSTLFPVVLAVTTRALRGHLQHPEVVMTTVFAARDSPVEEHALACLVDVRYLRAPVAPPGATWSQSVRRAGAELDWVRQHARTSFTQVVPVLPPVPPGQAPGTDIIFILQDNPLGQLQVPGCRVDPVPAHPPLSEAGLTIQLMPEPGDGLTVVVSHRCQQVSDQTAAALAEDVTALLDSGPS